MRALELEWPSIASEALRRQWCEIADLPLLRVAGAKATLSVATDLVPDWVAKCASQKDIAADFLYAFANRMSKGWGQAEQWRETWKTLSSHLRALLLGFVVRFAASRFDSFCAAIHLNVKPEWVEILSRMKTGELDELVNLNAVVHVSTETARSALDQKIRDLQTTFVRFKVPKVLDKDTHVPREYSDTVPTELAPFFEPMRHELAQSKEMRIANWPKLVEELHHICQDW